MEKYQLVLSRVFSTKKPRLFFALLTLLYLLITAIVLNYRLFTSFYHTSVTLYEKAYVTPAIIVRSFQTQTPIMLLLHLIIALLFALNITLVTTKIAGMNKKSLKFGLGAGIVSLTTAGCSACGLSLLTLVGLGGALTLLPFHGIEILLLTVGILTLTLFYNLNALTKACQL